jgi:hypothetical protein
MTMRYNGWYFSRDIVSILQKNKGRNSHDSKPPNMIQIGIALYRIVSFTLMVRETYAIAQKRTIGGQKFLSRFQPKLYLITAVAMNSIRNCNFVLKADLGQGAVIVIVSAGTLPTNGKRREIRNNQNVSGETRLILLIPGCYNWSCCF